MINGIKDVYKELTKMLSNNQSSQEVFTPIIEGKSGIFTENIAVLASNILKEMRHCCYSGNMLSFIESRLCHIKPLCECKGDYLSREEVALLIHEKIYSIKDHIAESNNSHTFKRTKTKKAKIDEQFSGPFSDIDGNVLLFDNKQQCFYDLFSKNYIHLDHNIRVYGLTKTDEEVQKTTTLSECLVNSDFINAYGQVHGKKLIAIVKNKKSITEDVPANNTNQTNQQSNQVNQNTTTKPVTGYKPYSSFKPTVQANANNTPSQQATQPSMNNQVAAAATNTPYAPSNNQQNNNNNQQNNNQQNATTQKPQDAVTDLKNLLTRMSKNPAEAAKLATQVNNTLKNQ